eukprot:scaffold5478_cov161-Amphora_coffeaeformis.AAC.6
MYIVSLDGTDFKCWEQKHPAMPIDEPMYSNKFSSAGWKYEIALSVYRPKCVWINGPHKGDMHDVSIFREQLKQKMALLPVKWLLPISDTVAAPLEKNIWWCGPIQWTQPN